MTDIDSHDVVSIGRVDLVETTVHLLFSDKGLDDAQTSQCLLHLTHRVAPQGLGLDRILLQLTTYPTHEPPHDGNDDEGEECQLPRDKEQGSKIADDENRVLEQHLERGHDGVLYLLHITTHAGNDVTLALLGEEA